MGRKCIIEKCKSGLQSCKDKLSFFTVPKNKLEQWKKAIDFDRRALTSRDTICEKHFKESDIIREIRTPIYSYKLKLPKLKPDAVPSRFPMNGNYQLRFKEMSPSPRKRNRVEGIMEYEPTEQDLLGTTPEKIFRSRLNLTRSKYCSNKVLTKKEYDHLVQRVLHAKKTNSGRILLKYNLVDINGEKKLIAAHLTDLKYYVHDDVLFQILQHTHIALQHGSYQKMMTELKKRYKNIIGSDVNTFLQLCPGCSRQKGTKLKQFKQPLNYSQLSSIYCVNLLDYRACNSIYKYVLVCHNLMTKFCELRALETTRAEEIADILMDIFCMIGTPVELRTQSTSINIERIVTKLCLNIKTVRNTQKNILEDLHIIDAAILKMIGIQKGERCKFLPFVQYQFNNKKITGGSRYNKMFGLEDTKIEDNKQEDIPKFFLPGYFKIPKPTEQKKQLETTFYNSIHDKTSVLTRKKYDYLIHEVKNHRMLHLYDSVEIDCVTRLITFTTTGCMKYYIHMDELFNILHYTHIYLNHAGFTEMSKKLSEKFENITDFEIKTYLSLCTNCKTDKTDPLVFSTSEMSSKCSVDLINYEWTPDNGYKFLMVYTNLLTRFCIFKPLKGTSLEETADNLIDIFSLIGVPTKIYSKILSYIYRVVKKIESLSPGVGHIKVSKGIFSIEEIDSKVKSWMRDNNTNKWTQGLDYLQYVHNKNSNKSPYNAIFGLVAPKPIKTRRVKAKSDTKETAVLRKRPKTDTSTKSVKTYKKKTGTRTKNVDKKTQEIVTFGTSELTERCSITLIDYSKNPDDDYKFIFVYQNPLTKFSLLRPLKTNTPQELAENLIEIFTLVGTSQIVESYQGPSFVRSISMAVEWLYPNLNFEYGKITYQNYKSVSSIQNEIEEWLFKNETTKWAQSLPIVQFMCNRRFDNEVGVVPFEGFFKCLDFSGIETKAANC